MDLKCNVFGAALRQHIDFSVYFRLFFTPKGEYKSNKYDNQYGGCLALWQIGAALIFCYTKRCFYCHIWKPKFIEWYKRNIHHNHTIHSAQFHFIWSIECHSDGKKMFNRWYRNWLHVIIGFKPYTDTEASDEGTEKKVNNNFLTKNTIEMFNDTAEPGRCFFFPLSNVIESIWIFHCHPTRRQVDRKINCCVPRTSISSEKYHIFVISHF